MSANKDFQLLSSNKCPDCAQPFLKHATGLDKGISCSNCGYFTKWETYHKVTKDYWLKNKDDNEEEL